MSDYRHTTGISKIYGEPTGRRLIIVDDKGDCYVYNPVSAEKVIPLFALHAQDECLNFFLFVF